MPFKALGLSAELAHAVHTLGFEQTTPIQSLAITPALLGRDILACAQTGSGKTLAFALPLLHQLATQPRRPGQNISALILVPTRELASQVGQTLQTLVQHSGLRLKSCTVHGGVSINPQMMALRGGADIVVATTGRLLDLVERNAIHLDAVRHLVLDEADRMLDLGFAEELSRIVQGLPAQRQCLLFSATFSTEVLEIANKLLVNPVKLDVSQQLSHAPDIAQRAILTDTSRRTQLLRQLIVQSKWSRVLVFVATKHAAEIVADKLRKADIAAEPFHGLLSQGKRSQVLQDFKTQRITAVVATDLAARGLDISDLPVVVNYDLPRSTDDYTHRVGRTARAGRSGLAVSFITPATLAHFKLIERRQGLVVEMEQIPGYEPQESVSAQSLATSAPDHGGIKGKRPSKKDKLRALAATKSAS